MKSLVLSSFFLLLPIVFIQAAGSSKVDSIAVLVGVDSESLQCSEDARLLSDTLQRCGMKTFLLTSDSKQSEEKPIRNNIITQLEKIELPKDSLLFFVFIGRIGTLSKTVYLCPEEKDYNNAGTTMLSLPQVFDLLKNKNARSVILLDSRNPGDSNLLVPFTVDDLKLREMPPRCAILFNRPQNHDSLLPMSRFFAETLLTNTDLNGDGKIDVSEILRFISIRPERFSYGGFRNLGAWDNEFFSFIPGEKPEHLGNDGKQEAIPIPPKPAPSPESIYSAHSFHNIHSGEVNTLAFSSVKKNLFLCATGGEDKIVRIFETSNSQVLYEEHLPDSISSVTWDESGNRLLVAAKDLSLHLWRVGTDEDTTRLDIEKIAVLTELQEEYRGKRGSVRAFFDSLHSRIIAVTSLSAYLWDDDSQKEYPLLFPFFLEQQSNFFLTSAAAVRPGTGQLLTAFSESPIELWDIDPASKKAASIRSFDSFRRANALAFSPEGERFVSGHVSGIATVWNTETGEILVRFDDHTDEITSVAFSPDGNSVLTGSVDGTARLWNPHTGESVQTFDGLEGYVVSVAFSPDGTFLALGLSNGSVILFSQISVP